MNRFLALEHVNLFCGTDTPDPGVSNHLLLSELQLPRFQERAIDHNAGGAPVAIEVDVILQKLEATFSLVGMQPQVARLLRPYSGDQTNFVALGFVRDPFDGSYTQAMAKIQGRLAVVAPESWRRGQTFHTQYMIHSIMKYNLQIAGFGNIVNWDFYNNLIMVG